MARFVAIGASFFGIRDNAMLQTSTRAERLWAFESPAGLFDGFLYEAALTRKSSPKIITLTFSRRC
jgi:hypothetical protein